MSMNVGELVAYMKVDKSHFDKGVNAGEQKFKGAAKNMEGSSRRMSGAVKGAAIGGLGLLTAEAAKATTVYNDYGKTIRTMSRLTDSSTEEISILAGQWKRYGIDTAKGVTSIKILSKQIVAAKSGNEDAIATFDGLGISMADLESKSPAALLTEIRDRMSEMEAGADRNTLAMKLMGKSGTDMMSWLDVSSEDMAAMTDKLKDLGMVWGDEEIQNWKDMKKAQAEASLAMTAFHLKFAESIIPLMTDVLEAAQPMLAVMKELAPALKYVGPPLAALLVAGKVAGAFTALKGAMAGMHLASFTSSLVGASGGIMSFVAKAGLIGAAVGGASYAIYEAVGAFREYKAAAEQAADAYKDFQENYSSAEQYIIDKYGKGSKQHESWKNKTAGAKKGAGKDKYEEPWWDVTAWFGEGGSFDARRPQMIGVGDRPEHVEVTPLNKLRGGGSPGSQPVSQKVYNIGWQTLTGQPSKRELQNLYRMLASVGGEVGGY